MPLLLLPLFLALLVGQVLCFQFYLHSGEKRCFTEAAAPNTKILAEYTVSTGRGRMPVDINVKMEGQHTTLYSRTNVDHGKFAFVVPFQVDSMPHVHQAEMHRKMRDHIHKVHHRNGRVPTNNDKPQSHHNRHVLSIDDHDQHVHDDLTHNARKQYQPDAHQDHVPHSANHAAINIHHQAHDPNHPDAHHDLHAYEDLLHDEHTRHDHVHDKDDDDEYDYDDDLDDFDADDYDGIGDHELEEEEERMARLEAQQHGRYEDASDEEKEERLFDMKKFEICVASVGDRSEGVKRRVRLVVHKGESAHDYTRLAKKEHMTQLEVSLRQVSGELHELMSELEQAREMENVLRELNENTNKRVVLFSLLSLFSLFAVGGYQAFYTKRFFERKKIL